MEDNYKIMIKRDNEIHYYEKRKTIRNRLIFLSVILFIFSFLMAIISILNIHVSTILIIGSLFFIAIGMAYNFTKMMLIKFDEIEPKD